MLLLVEFVGVEVSLGLLGSFASTGWAGKLCPTWLSKAKPERSLCLVVNLACFLSSLSHFLLFFNLRLDKSRKRTKC